MTRSRLAKTALAFNFVFSLASALTALLFAPAIAAMLGSIPAWMITGVGAGLLLFKAGIGWTLRNFRIGYVLGISILDFGWVLMTVPLVFIPGLLSATGDTIVLAIAAIVGLFGLVQLAGIHAIMKIADKPGQYRHCIRLHSKADANSLWAVIRNVGAIERYSAGLTSSRLETAGEVSEGTVRICTNTSNQSWAEEITEFDNNRRMLDMRFRSEDEGFPFPVAQLSGGWMVTPHQAGGSHVDVWWIVTPKQRRFGWLLVALMAIPLDKDLPKIVAAMEADAMGKPAPKMIPAMALSYC